MKNLCCDCMHRKNSVGSTHIVCTNPPGVRLSIGSGGDERYKKAEMMARESQAVVRCLWPGSGMFPGGQLIGFDSNTVFGCANHETTRTRVPNEQTEEMP